MFLNVSEEFKNKINSFSRTFRAKLVFDNFEITDDIFSIKVQGGMNLDTALTLGTTTSATCEVEILSNGRNYKNKQFQLMIGLKLDSGEYEFVPYGCYVVMNATKKEQKLSLSCADFMSKTDKIFSSSLNFPTTADLLLNDLCETFKLEHDVQGLENIIIPFRPASKTTGRELIGKIASLAGYNAVFDRYGVLNFKWYEDNGIETNSDYISNPDISEDNFAVEYLMYNITSKVSDIYGDTESETGVSVNNDFVLAGSQNFVWERISGFTYRPLNFKQILGNVLIDVWDIITIDGEIKTIPMSLDMTFDGGVSLDISATVPNTEKGFKSPAEIQAEKQAEKDENNSLVLVAENDTKKIISTKESELLKLEFTAQSTSLPFVNATLQLEDVSRGVVTANLKINGNIHQKYKISANDGYNLISFSSAFQNLSGGSNELSLHIEGDTDDMGVIQPHQASVILTGYGLVAQAYWNGSLVLYDVINTIFKLVESVSVSEISENYEFSLISPKSITASDKIKVEIIEKEIVLNDFEAKTPCKINRVYNSDNTTVVMEFSNMIALRNVGAIPVDNISLVGFKGTTPATINVYEAGLEIQFSENLLTEWEIKDDFLKSDDVGIDIESDYTLTVVNSSLNYREKNLENYTEDQLQYFEEVELESKDYKVFANYLDTEKTVISSEEVNGIVQFDFPENTAFVNVEIKGERLSLADLSVIFVKIEHGTESTVFKFSNKLLLKVDDLSEFNENISYSISDLSLINPFENQLIETNLSGSFTRTIFEEGEE